VVESTDRAAADLGGERLQRDRAVNGPVGDDIRLRAVAGLDRERLLDPSRASRSETVARTPSPPAASISSTVARE